MVKQFQPKNLPIIDSGNVPLFRIDGLESYFVRDGYTFSRYFVIEPLLVQHPDFSQHRPLIRRVCLSLIYSVAARQEMLRQAQEMLAPAGGSHNGRHPPG